MFVNALALTSTIDALLLAVFEGGIKTAECEQLFRALFRGTEAAWRIARWTETCGVADTRKLQLEGQSLSFVAD